MTKYLKSGLDYEEIEIQCCYSCSHCRKPDSYGRGVCALDSEKKYIYFKNYCTKYKDAGLILCAECDKWFRSLTRHVHIHKLTIDEYKEKHGYNRGTSLNSEATDELHSKFAKEHDLLGDSKGKHPEGSKGHSWRLREEGRMSFEENFSNRGGYEFMRKMIRRAVTKTTGVPISREHIEKISQTKTGKKFSKMHKARIAQGQRKFLETHTRIVEKNEKGHIINSYVVAK